MGGSREKEEEEEEKEEVVMLALAIMVAARPMLAGICLGRRVERGGKESGVGYGRDSDSSCLPLGCSVVLRH